MSVEKTDASGPGNDEKPETNDDRDADATADSAGRAELRCGIDLGPDEE